MPHHYAAFGPPRMTVLRCVGGKNSLTLWSYGDMYMVRIWFQIAFSRAISQPSKPLSGYIQPMNTSHLSSSGVIASFLSRLMGLTFSTILNVQIILDFAACEFFFPFPASPRRKENVPQHTKAPVTSIAAKSYIIFWAYGFLISRYSSRNDVTDMDSEHISNGFLQDIHYGCKETFDQIIKIDSLLYPELFCEISEALLRVIRGGLQPINKCIGEEGNRSFCILS